MLEVRRRRMTGFTLLELVVALGLLMLMSGLVAAGFSPWLAFQQDLDTAQRLEAQAGSWSAWLEHHAAELEGDPQQAGLPVDGNWLADGTSLADAGWRARLAAAFPGSGPALLEDGFHQPWLLRVSRSLVDSDHGVVLHYHRLALLSPGANGHLESGTRFDVDSGTLVLAGDDRGIVVDGAPIARRQLRVLESRLERAAAVWQDWFRARWEGDAERDPSIDYFSGPCPGDPLASAWDPASDALPPQCGADGDPAAPGNRLGLAAGELVDPGGAALHFDAVSDATRNPDNPDPGWRTPPYSAMVSGALPGGVQVRRTVLGTL